MVKPWLTLVTGRKNAVPYLGLFTWPLIPHNKLLQGMAIWLFQLQINTLYIQFFLSEAPYGDFLPCPIDVCIQDYIQNKVFQVQI